MVVVASYLAKYCSIAITIKLCQYLQIQLHQLGIAIQLSTAPQCIRSHINVRLEVSHKLQLARYKYNYTYLPVHFLYTIHQVSYCDNSLQLAMDGNSHIFHQILQSSFIIASQLASYIATTRRTGMVSHASLTLLLFVFLKLLWIQLIPYRLTTCVHVQLI